jgi:hypothetical protein
MTSLEGRHRRQAARNSGIHADARAGIPREKCIEPPRKKSDRETPEAEDLEKGPRNGPRKTKAGVSIDEKLQPVEKNVRGR